AGEDDVGGGDLVADRHGQLAFTGEGREREQDPEQGSAAHAIIIASIGGTDHRLSWSVVPRLNQECLTDDTTRSSVPPPACYATLPHHLRQVLVLIAGDQVDAGGDRGL